MKKLSRTNFIPSEIIEAILLRLPPHSLGRFRSVSKEWNSLISDAQFIKTHTHQLLLQPKPTKRPLAISNTTGFLYSIILNIDNIINGIPSTATKITLGSPPMRLKDVLGSCNGLVLARDLNDAMFLINPTTHCLCKLPVNTLAYDTDMYSVFYGFGYDSSTDDYKVVSFYFTSRTADSYNKIVSIYSLRNNSWRKLPNTPRYLTYSDIRALVNGNCHWLPKYPSESIIVFSFVDQLFSEIKLPDSILKSYFWYSAVVEIGGRLGVYLFFRSGDSELWVMQEYGDAKSWTRVVSYKGYMYPVCLLEESNRDIVVDGEHGVAVFNIDKGRRRNVKIIGGRNKFTIRGSFVETMESPKRIITTP